METRRKVFAPLSTPFWDFQPLIDRGNPGLEDKPALGFSLLPRHKNAPLLEYARTAVAARFPSSREAKATRRNGLLRRVTNEEMRIVPVLQEEPQLGRPSSPEWVRAWVSTQATLYGTNSNTRRGGNFRLIMRYASHRSLPLIRWQLVVENQGTTTVKIQRVTLLRVGPLKSIKPHSPLDFLPTRFRLFSLRHKPETQSAYYNITQRFGSLRLHPLDTPILSHRVLEARDAEVLGRLLPPEAALSAKSEAVLIAAVERRSAVLFTVEPPPQARLEAQVNADSLAPGISLSLTFTETILSGNGGIIEFPTMTAFWLAPEGDSPEIVWRLFGEG